MKQLEEEKSNSQRTQEQLNQLSGKMRSLRREKEDAEGEAESLQKKLKQSKAQTEDAEDTNAMLQAQISKMRAAARKPKVLYCSYRPCTSAWLQGLGLSKLQCIYQCLPSYRHSQVSNTTPCSALM